MTNEQREQLKAIEEKNQYGVGYITVKKWKNEGLPYHRINRTVRDCYGRPSIYKTRAERSILDFMDDINNKTTNLFATDYTVLSYNTNMFTAGFMVYDQTKRNTENGGLIAYYYFTRTKSERYEF